MSDLFDKNGTKFDFLARGSAFEAYLSRLSTTAFPLAIGKHTHGKRMIAYGDSLTQYSGGDGLTGYGFLSQVNKYLGMEITQLGLAGSRWTGTGAGDAPTRVQELLDAGVSYDVVTLAWGTNSDADTGGNGTIDDEPSSTGSMVAVMKWAINSIREAYPFSGLGIIIPPEGISGMKGGEKADLMIEVCKAMRVPYLDLFYGANLDLEPVSGGLGTDQVHLYTTGRNRYASALGQFIERLCPYTKHYSIAYSLTNATSSNDDIWRSEGDSFSATISASSGSLTTVKVTMGGKDVTSTCYADGVINITQVTGNVSITASAE